MTFKGASKGDLDAAVKALNKSISAVETKLNKKINDAEKSLKKDIASTAKELEGDMAALEKGVNKDLNAMENKIGGQLTALEKSVDKSINASEAKLETEMAATEKAMQKYTSDIEKSIRKDVKEGDLKNQEALSELEKSIAKNEAAQDVKTEGLVKGAHKSTTDWFKFNWLALLEFLKKFWLVLVHLLTDPLGFILKLAELGLWPWLDYNLGWALVRPNAKWSSKGPTSKSGGKTSIPTGFFDLGAPLGSLSISGNLFSPTHRGLDLALSDGAPVYAMHDGTIEVPTPTDTYPASTEVGYGIQVIVSGDEFWTRYAHLKQVTKNAGQSVQRGEVIGFGDSTGASTGPHLHLEIKQNGNYVDPRVILGL